MAMLLVPLGCENPFASREEFELIVLEQMTQCMNFGMILYPCLNVIQPPETQAYPLYGNIKGFTFEPGIRQRIRVARYRLNNPPMDGSSYEYRLLRVISRERRSIVITVEPLVSAQTVD